MNNHTLSRRQFLQLTAAAAAGTAAWQFTPAFAQTDSAGTPFETALAGPGQGHWRRLFLDAWAVEEQQGLARVFHAAEKHPVPVLKSDKPWDSVPAAITGPYVYGTVARDGSKLRLWYQVLTKGNHVGYAESIDGIHWTKPDLGIIEFNGSKANNFCLSAAQREVGGGECHNPSVLRCPEPADPDKRYALFGFDGKAGHARVAFSPDGLHWKYVPETEKKALFTSSDVVNFFYDPYQKRYTVTWKTRSRRGRAVGVGWSQDALTWTKPYEGPLFAADDLDPDATQIYGMPVFPYQGLYIGQPWMYHARYFKSGDYSVKKLHEAQEDSPRTMEVQLAWSWDLINWTRAAGRQQFIPRGAKGQWDAGMIVTARAPVLVGDKLYFYYGGCDGLHDDKRVNAAIGLATLRLDGFCSMRAGINEGWLIGRRDPFRRPVVTINARTGTNGYVTAEILDRRNKVVPGFSKENCVTFQGDSVRHELKWKSSAFTAAQKASDYKIRFWLKNAELFSYLPADLDPAQPDIARLSQPKS
ncbi:MAG TPA: twin-arginine translocation signal domain-containing protein [Candidatus Paceibacterota bacterium]|nr:twin-arginine translocation signal domain-containing protein [Verrucomicrobiota bacterium]HSA12356.1 twin-arginine translocation signal domain-containing protein [Candidatus Paceibacterota bacterium]